MTALWLRRRNLGDPKNVDPEEAFVASLPLSHAQQFWRSLVNRSFVWTTMSMKRRHMEKNAEGKLRSPK